MQQIYDLFRHGMKIFEGRHGKPPSANIVEGGNTHHQSWLSTMRGGKPAVKGMITHGAEKHDGGPDPLKFIRQHDPQNSSGAWPDSLNVMEKLRDATRQDQLISSMQPLQNILGGQLMGAFQKAGASAKSSEKVQNNQQQQQQQIDVVALLIQTAMDNLSPDDHAQAAELLDDVEINLISSAYYGNGTYTSTKEIATFVAEINKLIPIFRASYGTSGVA